MRLDEIKLHAAAYISRHEIDSKTRDVVAISWMTKVTLRLRL
jgi:hypothetical protein